MLPSWKPKDHCRSSIGRSPHRRQSGILLSWKISSASFWSDMRLWKSAPTHSRTGSTRIRKTRASHLPRTARLKSTNEKEKRANESAAVKRAIKDTANRCLRQRRSKTCCLIGVSAASCHWIAKASCRITPTSISSCPR